jgi:hypothetical protein
MYTTSEERQKLTELRESVRSRVEALELCWSCQRISECDLRVIDDGPAVPICGACVPEIRTAATGSNPIWPAIS